ncbi:MAG: YdiU family protein [Bacteroidales bacterium]|nr:YdiU family protein [Bacteroidales bacterium]
MEDGTPIPVDSVGWHFDNTFTSLPDVLYTAALPAPVRHPQLVILNAPLAASLGLQLHTQPPETLAALFAGQVLPPGANPVAWAYAGHQYGHFTMLGDGRAILLGEQRTPSGQLFDIQLKGAGPTRFSRRGDGRAALGPMLREYLISEAMAGLGIPTTRSLAVVTTGEPVYRDTILPGAILTRVAASHIRVGTFQYLAARGDTDQLRALADYTIRRHDPDVLTAEHPYRAFFQAVADRQAALVARWQLVGFVHGVMNTDNTAISGETIDYGPCAFMNRYDPATVFSSIDSIGRYAYGNQPAIIHWNLARFAESLLPLLDPDPERAVAIAVEMLNNFPATFERYWLQGMRQKLGLQTEESDDAALVQSLLDVMEQTGADYTNTFFHLSQEPERPDNPFRDARFPDWHARWQARLAHEGTTPEAARAAMRQVNPVVIPRNHQVEAVLAAAETGDLAPLQALLAVLQSPFVWTAHHAAYQSPPDHEQGYRTFCGT